MKVHAGRTLFISASQKSANHLWIVLTDPIGDPPQVVIVSLSTLREGSDATVVLRPGDHPFVVHDTVVFYADAKLVHVSQLIDLVASGVTQLHADCSADLLLSARQGLLESPFTPRWLKGFCRQYCDWAVDAH